MGKLTVAKVKNAKPVFDNRGTPKANRLADGDGLYLLVRPTGGKSWVLRVQVDGKRRDIGLGSFDSQDAGRNAFGAQDPWADTPLMLRKSLSLAEAREKAAALRKLTKAGADPIVERDRDRRKPPTFAEAITHAHNALASGWSERTAKAFKASLEEHASPKLGPMRVSAIGSADILLSLAPIWHDKPVMARKVRARILQVLAFAKARGWRTDSLPDSREMRSGLSRQAKGGNFAAIPYIEVPVFVAGQLGLANTSSRAALLFAILTGARSGEVRQAAWEHIDLEARTWTRPASIMKMDTSHVVTLNAAAIAIVQRMAPMDRRTGMIFPGIKRGRPLSDMSLTKVMRLAERTETVHGFRSAFRDWAAEQMPTTPAMVAEMALAHRVGTATEQAYLRSDLRDMRRALMDAWGLFVAPALANTDNSATPMRKSNSE